jgi:hypothetical protein
VRLAAIRSFFHRVAASDPVSLGVAQRALAIPVKKSHTEVTHHLARHEFKVSRFVIWTRAGKDLPIGQVLLIEQLPDL